MTELFTLGMLFLPLASFVLLFFARNVLRQSGPVVACVILLFSLISSISALWQVFAQKEILMEYQWLKISPHSSWRLTFLLNEVSLWMSTMVVFISLLVHLYSLAYMKEDKRIQLYYAYLGMFTFSMLGIVLSDHLLLTYFFWEWVGISSYLLIGFWYEKNAAFRAAKKAFLLNRVGDTLFLAGILWFYVQFDTFQISELREVILANHSPYYYYHIPFSLAGFLLFCGPLAKSAQVPLHIWLPDAMEGPTPVSALIHAATMVAAGVYFSAKVIFLFSLPVSIVIAFTGSLTAFVGAVSAMAQYDIKKVLAFSTVSQLGLMMLAVGVGASQAALFHLFTHAFFKACLFLCAGAIIHELHRLGQQIQLEFDAQNMYLMGGLRKKMPLVYSAFLVSALSLAGIPLFSGFLSKDAILFASVEWAWFLAEKGSILFAIIPILVLLTVFFTALYISRAFLFIFYGDFTLEHLYSKAGNSLGKIKDAGPLIKWPLLILAVFCLWPAFATHPLDPESSWLYLTFPRENWILAHNPSKSLHLWLAVISVVLSVGGVLLAFGLRSRSKFKEKIMLLNSNRVAILSMKGFYVNQLYEKRLIPLAIWVSNFTSVFDKKVIDRLVELAAVFQVVLAHILAWLDKVLVDGIVHLVVYLSGRLGKLGSSIQNGKVQRYYIFSLLAFLLWLWWALGSSL